MRRPTALGRYDADEREVRFVDQLQYFTWLIIVLCLVGMGLWVHHIADNVKTVGKAQQREARQLAAEATRLGADRTQLINGCERLNHVLAAINTTSAGDYTLFSFIVRLSSPEQTGYRQLERAVASQSWTRKTRCVRLIDAVGSHYALPNAIPFTQRFPPPSQLLHPSQTPR